MMVQVEFFCSNSFAKENFDRIELLTLYSQTGRQFEGCFGHLMPTCSLYRYELYFHKEFAEEELEWLSNKDAFPTVETCFGSLLSGEPGSIPKHHSPVSVLENSTTSSTSNSGNSSNSNIIMSYCRLRVPVKARSKRHHRHPREIQEQECWWSQENFITRKPAVSVAKLGRKCQHCGVEKTPQWRAGPDGPKTLCNACGVRYKSGRLVPEYRPANSPTFSSKLHSNSHRKVVEMRRQKQMMGLLVAKPMDKG
ncbi:GATA transcription factor 1-like isoform X2 [Populus nigra]|uniref:GATA transcription factor 1-like isoform X2 n=1 Tax=Populus nigra TaxID=3691 RepID=UPI002B26DD00|nr:GATA transcription factor 1-like isoform X2 [Populus nigra]